MAALAGTVAQVILDTPLPQLDHPFDYRIPEHLQGRLEFGVKVAVPLRSGNRRSEGWVIGVTDTSSFTGNLAVIDSLISPVASLTPELYALARTVADRQAGSVVDVLRLAIPPRFVRAEKDFLSRLGSELGNNVPVPDVPESLGPAFNLELGTRLSLEVQGGVGDLTGDSTAPQWVRALIRACGEQIRSGFSTILCVPDFRDLSLVEEALRVCGLGALTVRTDSGLSGAQRWLNYLRIINEEPLIVLGNRSSIYAPVKNLGLIAMWDSADESFTEQLAPYAHPRDVALIRQSESGCSLVFAAHVPSVETTRLVSLNYLSERIWGTRDNNISATDAQADKSDESRSSRIPPVALVAARLAVKSGPVLVQVARPGYAATVKCANCRERAMCTSCHGPLGLTKKNASPACRWCGRLEPAWSCHSCHSTVLMPGQAGTEKTADDLARAFPGFLVHLVDSSKEAQTVAPTPALVIATAGTEPFAVGGYAAVLILDGEVARSRADLDTDTSALRSWTNAIALAAPGAPVFVAGTGRVLGEVMETGSFKEFSLRTLQEREGLGLPPTTRAAVMTGSRSAIQNVEAELTHIPHRSVLGPVPHTDDTYRLIVTFDYKDGFVVAKALRSLILKTAVTTRKPQGASNSRGRVLRLNVRIDDFALRGIG